MKEMHNRKFAVLVLLGLMLIQAGCARQGRGTNDKPDEPVVTENTEQVEVVSATEVEQVASKINVFIENSASMDGYIKGFKPAIKNLVVDLKGNYKIGLNYVNMNIINRPLEKNQDPIDIVTKMLGADFANGCKNKADRKTTKLNDIIKLVLGQTNDSTVSILVSDCIYSIKDNDKKTSNEDKLEDLKVETKNQFKNSSIKDLSVLFIRLESRFNGSYYDYNDAPISLKDCDRPYYMCVIGTDKNLRKFMDIISIEELAGYSCHYYMSGKDFSNTFYTIVSKPFNKGRYVVDDFSTIRLKNPNDLQFAIAINLDGFPMSKEEKMDLANYVIDGNFNKVDLVPIDSNIEKMLSPNEINNIKSNGCTHLLVVSSNGFPSDFTIKVKPTIPEWVNELSSIDDTGISNDNKEELRKTFGISYFINGAAAAYERDSYFTMSIKIKQ